MPGRFHGNAEVALEAIGGQLRQLSPTHRLVMANSTVFVFGSEIEINVQYKLNFQKEGEWSELSLGSKVGLKNNTSSKAPACVG